VRMPPFGSSAWMRLITRSVKVRPFISRFTKDRNSYREQAALEWKFTSVNGSVEVATQAASSLDVFRQWLEDGLTSAEDIAREMHVTKGTVSKLARKAMDQGWLKKNGREYAFA
jgi:hypothetical protein